MKTKDILIKLAGLTLAAASLFLSACDRTGGSSESGKPVQRRAAAQAPQNPPGADTPEGELKRRIGRLRPFAAKHNPADRPTITSREISDVVEWKMATLLEAHQRSGLGNPASFPAVSNVFRQYSQFSSGVTQAWTNLQSALGAAMDAGTRDPFIEYLVWEHRSFRTNSNLQTLMALADIVVRLQESAHHPLFRHEAARSAAKSAALHESTAGLEEHLEGGVILQVATQDLEDAAKDRKMPWPTLYRAIVPWMDYKTENGWDSWVMGDLEDLLDANWAGLDGIQYLKGRTEIDRAWKARGSDVAAKVGPEAFRKFDEHLAKAASLLEKSWSLDTNQVRVARSMMRVELGQGQGLARERIWFDRVMALDTNHYGACDAMCLYLEPRWHGSEALALQFARSCVASTKWGGDVPLVLQHLHHRLASYYGLAESDQYWHRPQVWTDVRSSYEKFFRLNPNDDGTRHHYARDAFKCGQYAAFLQQLPKFTAGTNYAFFDGVSAFNRMVAQAKAKSGK